MGLDLDSMFKKNANKKPVSNRPVAEELPDSEEPVAIADSSMLRSAAPKGARFNRNTMLMLAGTFAIILIAGVMHAFEAPKKSTPQEEAEKAFAAQGKQMNAQTPSSLNKLPDSYGAVNQQAAAARKLGQPTPAVLGSMERAAAARRNSGGEIEPGLSAEERENISAKKSPIRFGGANGAGEQKLAQGQPKNSMANQMLDPAAYAAAQGVMSGLTGGMGGGESMDANGQEEKRGFVDKNRNSSFYVKSSLQEPVSSYEVKAGTVIPGVFITGLNSDLPGQVMGQVRENVYDTVTGRYLLIPQGTRLIGEYDSKVTYGQERALVVWTRLIMPNGDSIDLENMQGTDVYGYAGVRDKVNNHTARMVRGALITSLLAAGAKIAAGNDENSFKSLAAQGAGENVASAGAKMMEKNLNAQPTIEVRPGFKFNVFVDADLILRPYTG